MKHRSKLVCILLAMILVLAMSVPAFADEETKVTYTDTITVNNAQPGETYKLYKMLDLSVDTDNNAYTYTLNTKWAAFFEEGGAGAAYVDLVTVKKDTTEEKTYVTWKEAADKENFAKAAAKYAEDNSIEPENSKKLSDGETTADFGKLAHGYYLITSTKGTLAIVLTSPSESNVTINEKNPDSTINKLVQEDSTEQWGEENSAQIGDTVYFKSTVTVKKGAKNYVVHDKMDDGLTLKPDTILVTGLTKGTDFTVVTEGLGDGCTFEIHFTQSYLDNVTTDTELTITYSAVLNENADLTTGEYNKTKLTWGDSSETAWDNTLTKTYQFDVLKYDARDNAKKPLAGATFELYDKSGNKVSLIKVSDTEYRVANLPTEAGNEKLCNSFVTVASGNIKIVGVDLDKYTLKETIAPPGFELLSKDKEAVVNSTTYLTVEVPNNSGTALPSTGGIGTTVFYVVGAALVLGAVVILITRKRMGTK